MKQTINFKGFSFGAGLFAMLTAFGIFFNSPSSFDAWAVWVILSGLGILNFYEAFKNETN
jgi:putative Mn2+ efflux pump MntP